jgi:hypothetical protein
MHAPGVSRDNGRDKEEGGGEVRMSRPQKEGLDYFPLDSDIDGDDKFQLLEAEHGIIGFGVVIKLFMKIYKNGYYYPWTEKEKLLHSKRVGVELNTVNKIVNDAVKWGLFDEDVFKKHKVLTSHGIQKRYVEAVKRRNSVLVTKEYWVCDDINAPNVNIYPQSKVNKIKANKTKETDGSSEEATPKEEELKPEPQAELALKKPKPKEPTQKKKPELPIEPKQEGESSNVPANTEPLDLRDVLDFYLKTVQKDLESAADISLAKFLIEMPNMTMVAIKKGVEQSAEAYKPKFPGQRMPFIYCKPAIFREAEIQHTKKKGATSGGGIIRDIKKAATEAKGERRSNADSRTKRLLADRAKPP